MTLEHGGARRNTAAEADREPSLGAASGGFKPEEAGRFLRLLGKDRAVAWLRFIDPLKQRKGGADHQGVSSTADLAAIRAKDAERFNVYAVIGNAATIAGRNVKDTDISSVPTLFVEWDDGADIEEQAQRWRELGLPEPSVMVTTGGKSVHCYWVLDQPMAPEPWKVLTKRLIAHCNSDSSCSNPSRVMRMPGSTYYSKSTGEPTGQCRIIGGCESRYGAETIADCLPSPATLKPAAAAPKGQWEPRGIDEINAAAEFIPRRTAGNGTYPEDRNAICGCSAALAEAGVADPDAAALALLGHLWPTEAAARQVLDTTNTRKAGAFWKIAAKHGYGLKRKATAASSKGSTVGTGNAVRLKPNQVLELLEQRIGTLKLNTRSGDITAGGRRLGRNTIDRLYLELSSANETWGKEVTADAVIALAERNAHDPVADYLNSNTAAPLPLEQWQRLDQHLLGIDDPIAAEFLPRYLIGAVARVFAPGCDVRQCPVLVGPQWRGKTALGRILFGAEHWVSGVGDLGKDALERVHTAWGVELAELDGITRRSDQESLKAFLTETSDTYRRPYDRAPERHLRRFVFWGTSNGAALRDTTGNTRFVTIPIPDRMLPLEWVAEHRNGLWARAVEQYRAGADWDRCSDATRVAIADRNANYTEQDPWHGRILERLERAERLKELPVSIVALLDAVEVPVERQRKAEGQRVRQIAESLGWVMDRRQIGDDRRRGMWPPLPQLPQQCHNSATTEEPSQRNGSAPAATTATTKREKLETAEQGEHPAPASNGTAPHRSETFQPFVVAQWADRSDPLPRNGSELPQQAESVVAPVVAPVSPGYIPGWIDPAPAPIGSGADVADGDDLHWDERVA